MTTQPDIPENYSFSPQCMNCHTIVTNIRPLVGQQVHRWTCSNCGEKCVGHFSKPNGKWNWALEKHENLPAPKGDLRNAVNYHDYMTQLKNYENELLNERQKTHGDFEDNARISQELKAIFDREMTDTSEYNYETDVIAESLDMIALKLSRVLSGQANRIEHWEDIAGYAQLVVKDLEKSK